VELYLYSLIMKPTAKRSRLPFAILIALVILIFWVSFFFEMEGLRDIVNGGIRIFIAAIGFAFVAIGIYKIVRIENE